MNQKPQLTVGSVTFGAPNRAADPAMIHDLNKHLGHIPGRPSYSELEARVAELEEALKQIRGVARPLCNAENTWRILLGSIDIERLDGLLTKTAG